MEIKYLITKDCPFWKKGLVELKKVIKELKIEKKTKIKIIEIKNEKDAKKYKFAGSPTIRIGDYEIGSEMETTVKPTLLSCRIYLFKGKVFYYPPKEMIKEFIQNLAIFKEIIKE